MNYLNPCLALRVPLTAVPGSKGGREVATGAAGLSLMVTTAEISQVRPGQAERPDQSLTVQAAVQDTAVAAGHTHLSTPASQHTKARLHTLTLNH